MGPVQFNRKWEINTLEDYENAIKVLDDNDYCAEMSDSYEVTKREHHEVSRQRFEVILQAREKGLIK